jgi:replicative DNA helicase
MPNLEYLLKQLKRKVYSCILIDKNAIVDISVLLRPEMFYNENNGKVYEAMMALYENRDPIDVLTVSDWLKKVGSN